MNRKVIALGIGLVGLIVSACSGHISGGSGSSPEGFTYMLPPVDSDLVMYATLPKHTIGEELPGEGLGKIKSTHWKATLGGFTQQRYSQALGFPPGTQITIRNLSGVREHTLDVVKKISGPPAIFPKSPNLSIPARGHGKLEIGYASGPIKPGKSVTVTLVKRGIYLIGCAFHYAEGMRDVLVVGPHAIPGPQATAPPSSRPTTSPTIRSSYDPSE
jgi:plastocyanin